MPGYPENKGRRNKMGTSEELCNAVHRFQEGEREAFNDIYKMSYSYLHTCVSRTLDNENMVQDMLQEIIDRLPPMQRICIVAYYYGLSQQEIAEELKVPLNTVKSYLSRARKKSGQRFWNWRNRRI